MGSRRDSRRSKAREKHRKKRDKARRTRGSRTPAGAGTDATPALQDAARWPVGDAWLSEHWREPDAHINAAFVREHSDQRAAVALFEMDLGGPGVVAARSAAGVPQAAVQGELVRFSEAGKAMVQVDPAQVVAVVEAAVRMGRANGHALPDGYQRAILLFGGVDAADAPEEVEIAGDADPSEAGAASGGLLASLKRRLGLSG